MTDAGVLRNIEIELRDIRDRVIRIEAAGVDRQLSANASAIEKLKEDVRKLEGAESRREGAKGLFQWIAQYGPGLVLLTIAVVMGMLAAKIGKLG